MQVTFTVTVDLDRLEGKFVSKEDIAEEIKAEIEGSNPGEVMVEDSTYEITEWEVEYSLEKPRKSAAKIDRMVPVVKAPEFTVSQPAESAESMVESRPESERKPVCRKAPKPNTNLDMNGKQIIEGMTVQFSRVNGRGTKQHFMGKVTGLGVTTCTVKTSKGMILIKTCHSVEVIA